MKNMLVLLFFAATGSAALCSDEGLPENRQKIFALCCNAVAVGDKENQGKLIKRLYEFNVPCEEIWSGISSYCNQEKSIVYSQFKLHQTEILVYMSLLHYAIEHSLLQDQQRKRSFIHWYNKQNKQLQQWL